MKTYEAMFLLDPSQPNFDAACEPIKRVFERSNAEVIKIRLWDEIRLAYEIENRKRGLYVLTYFKMPAENVAKLERDCQLSEDILRIMVLRKDRLTEEEMNAETPAQIAAAAPVATEEEAVKPAEAPAAPAEKPAEVEAPAAEAVAETAEETPAAE